MSEENKAIVRRFVEQVQNRHDVNAVDELVSPLFVDRSGMEGIEPTREGTKQFLTVLFATFPDLHFTVEDMVAEGDKVVTRKTFHGTHQARFLGIPDTGNRVDVEVIDIMRIAGGQIVEHWAEADMLGLMQQLGAVPPPGQSGG